MGQDEQQKLERLQVPEIGELLDGRYCVQGVIATGGMGVILRAEQLPMERPVAIKLLHPHIAASDRNIVDRFAREVCLAKQLNHPNTIRLYDFGESDEGLVYVAMELLDGMDLKRRIAREGAMRVGTALEITRQMLDGLAEAHARGFIHRDLKPSNVFIVKSRRGEDLVKVLDFGIAKSLGDSADLTGSGSICGTPSYVAPEYLMQERPGKPADIYAVGLILLEMLTGRQVFKGDAPVQTMMMHLKLDPDIPDEIAETPLAAVIERATAKDPTKRYQDAEEMYEAVCEVSRKVPEDLIVRRPELEALPKLTEGQDVEFDTDERERAAVDTIVPEAPAAKSSAEAGLTVKMGGAIVVLALVGVGVFWALNPGNAPELAGSAAPSQEASKVREVPAVAEASPGEVAAASAGRDREQAEANPREISFELDTEPVGASVFIGDEGIGRTPMTHWVVPEKLPQTVRFELEGYEPRQVELTRTSSPIVVEILEERQRRVARDTAPKKAAGATSQKRPTDQKSDGRSDELTDELTDEHIERVMDQYLAE